MENATAIFYGEKGVTEGRAPVVHEVAHQWFGNSVTERDWDDVWLSEGFASYFTHLYTEHFEGREAMEADLRASRATIDEVERKMPDTPIVHRNLADMKRVLNGLVYQKGAWVLHMLREEVGLDAFWKGIRAYYGRYRDGNASTDDFRQTMEQASGRSLSWFFDQWLKRGGIPQVAGVWRYDAARKAVYVTLTQQPTAAPYRLNVDVALRDAAGVVLKRERLSLSAPSRTYEIGIETAPSDALLDPDVTTLAVLRPLTRSR
jgi:aminopeptidase N